MKNIFGGEILLQTLMKNIDIILCRIKCYDGNYHDVGWHPLLIGLFHYYFLSSKHTLVWPLISYIPYWLDVVLPLLCFSSHWSQFLQGSTVDCPESSVPDVCLFPEHSVNALGMLVTLQFRINIWKMSQLRENWNEAKKSNILWKLQMFKGNAIYCLFFIDPSGIYWALTKCQVPYWSIEILSWIKGIDRQERRISL